MKKTHALSCLPATWQSYMLMNFESRAIVMEDVGRQILASNKHVSPARPAPPPC